MSLRSVEIPPLDQNAAELAKKRVLSLTMPPWALGRICDTAVWLAACSGRLPPPVERRCIVTMAADHGVVSEGVTPHGQEVTRQMVANIASGGAGVNVLARLNRTRVVVADLGMASRDENLIRSGAVIDASVGRGTANMAKSPAMTRAQACRALEAGMELAERLAPEVDLFATGEMGIGNTTSATAITACLTGRPVALVCGTGAGLPVEALAHKISVIETILAFHQPDRNDAVDILTKIGGFEIGGIAGLVLGAARLRRPVVVDGFISTAGAMLAKLLAPGAMEYVMLAHASAEPGHSAQCEWLDKTPLLDLVLRLGEGTGAAMAMNIIDAAARILTEMATFSDAGVTVNTGLGGQA